MFIYVIILFLFIAMKNYKSLSEIIEIYRVPQQTVNMILKKYKIDIFKNKHGLQINIKDFNKIYTSFFNPSLFVFKPQKNKKSQISFELDSEMKNNWNTDIQQELFVKIFSQPYHI